MTYANLLRSHRWLLVGLSFFLLISGLACSRGGQAQGAPSGRRGDIETPVAAAAAGRRDLARHVTLTAPVEPIRIVGVNSRASGTILSVHVIEGNRVREGELLAELDARETEAQLERAQAILATARSAFERGRQLHENQMITTVEFEQARAAYETAASDVQLWTTRLDFTRVLAPTAGMVTVKYVEAGSAVSVNQRLFDIADDTLMVIRVQMSELDVVHVMTGDRVTVVLDAYPGVEIPGWVRRVFPAADPQTRLVPVEVALGAPPRGTQVKPGFLGRVEFALGRRPDVLTVPASAVGAGGTGPFVFVIDADTLVRRGVQTGLTSEGYVEIASGLDAGELVVTSGQVNLRAGAPVRITARADDSAAAAEDSRE